MSPPEPMPVSFYARPADRVARELLGCRLYRRLSSGTRAAGRIVETEAYFGPDDPASHAFTRTPRSEIMYGPPGVAYVYFTYGIHHCLNAVTGEQGEGSAVLIRALKPLEDLEGMAERRGPAARDEEGRPIPSALCSGPAKLTQALSIDRGLNGVRLQGPEIWIAAAEEPLPDEEVETTPRIGIREAKDRLARYVVGDSPCRSR
ncbi:MAG: DNA-3-methyladenine glycosylase [bacterium]